LIVLDASAAIDWFLETPVGLQIEQRIFRNNELLCAPHLLDLELVQVLRRLARENILSVSRAEQAIADFVASRIIRYPHSLLLARIWQLRHNLSAYDAAYIALAETVNATLITRDARLARASGHTARIELF
jgi:predicted nucleic acid-binding protein